MLMPGKNFERQKNSSDDVDKNRFDVFDNCFHFAPSRIAMARSHRLISDDDTCISLVIYSADPTTMLLPEMVLSVICTGVVSTIYPILT